MRITEASEVSGLGPDTIRYYERAGMTPKPGRDGRGWRDYGPDTVQWLVTLARLRNTGMPMDEMRAFALSAHGPGAETPQAKADRLAILQRHAGRLTAQRAELEACAAYLDQKITIYTNELETDI
jgi:DNA-binding transcriptional MerR regulator